MSKVMTQDELQHIEHGTKILQEHQDVIRGVINETETMLNTYVPILSGYIESIARLRMDFGKEVQHIVQSTREIKVITGGTQQILEFCSAVENLNKILTPDLIEKIRRINA